MSKHLNTILVGAGGYGRTYGNYILDKTDENLSLTAVVDPYLEKSPIYDRLKNACPIYDRLEDFFATGASADLTIIASPIYLHFEHSMTALENGSHVYCEKPLVPTVKELNLLEEKAAAVGKVFSVGFQWCYSDVMLGLKKRILAGEFGKALSFKAVVSWPRGFGYYSRSSWVGKIKDESGRLFYDSIASNATSHHIQNMLFFLGNTMEDSAEISNIQMETYRANNIESFDTCAFRGKAGDASVFLAATHAATEEITQGLHFTFENAEITINNLKLIGDCTIRHKDGRVETPGDAAVSGVKNRLKYTVQSVKGERPAICTPRTVRPITAFVDAMFNNISIHNFPSELVTNDIKAEQIYVKNLHLDLLECFNQGKLPSELGLPWAKEAVRF